MHSKLAQIFFNPFNSKQREKRRTSTAVTEYCRLGFLLLYFIREA